MMKNNQIILKLFFFAFVVCFAGETKALEPQMPSDICKVGGVVKKVYDKKIDVFDDLISMEPSRGVVKAIELSLRQIELVHKVTRDDPKVPDIYKCNIPLGAVIEYVVCDQDKANIKVDDKIRAISAKQRGVLQVCEIEILNRIEK